MCVKGKSAARYGGQDQGVVPGSEKGARLDQAYLSESGIFGRQVPFCLDLRGGVYLEADFLLSLSFCFFF